MIGDQIRVKIDVDTSKVVRAFNETAWRTTVALLGYAYAGWNSDPGVLTAELRPGLDEQLVREYRLFDRHEIDLLGEYIVQSGVATQPVPLYWALPWVTEHLRREETSG